MRNKGSPRPFGALLRNRNRVVALGLHRQLSLQELQIIRVISTRVKT